MATTVQDILTLLKTFHGADTGSVSASDQILHINTAISYYKRKLGLPSDEDIHSFQFSDDQFFYELPSNFDEELQLVYDDANLNIPEREWEYRHYSEMLRRTGIGTSKNLWSFTTINGTRQLMLIGNNINKGSTIDDLDAVGDWTIAGDGSSLEQDLLEKRVGDGALKFDITASAGTVTLNKDGLSLAVKSLFENHALFKLWVRMTDTTIDSWAIRLKVTDLKYWTITETDFDDGTAFTTGENLWKKIGWSLDDAVETGSPLITDTVTEIDIIIDLGAGFVSAADFRIDHLFTSVPDYMNLVYRTANKGKTAAGVALTKLTAATDTIDICDFIDGFDDLIARRAAVSLWPALRGDETFYQSLKAEERELLRDHGRSWPRRKVNRFLSTRLRR